MPDLQVQMQLMQMVSLPQQQAHLLHGQELQALAERR